LQFEIWYEGQLFTRENYAIKYLEGAAIGVLNPAAHVVRKSRLEMQNFEVFRHIELNIRV